MREYRRFLISITGTAEPGEFGFGLASSHQTSYGMREKGKDWTGNSVYLWAIANAVYMSLLGPQGFRELGELILQRAHYAARRLAEIKGVKIPFPPGFFKEFVVNFDGTGKSVARDQRGAARARHFRRQGSVRRIPRARPERALLRDRDPYARGHRPAGRRARGGDRHDERRSCLRKFHAARLGRAGRHGAGPSRPPRPDLPRGRAARSQTPSATRPS